MSTSNIQGEHHLDARSTNEIETLENKLAQIDNFEQRNPELGEASGSCYSSINDPAIWLPPELKDEKDDVECAFLNFDDFITENFKNHVQNALSSTNEDCCDWVDIITSLTWQAAPFVEGEVIDYHMKVKCLLTGSQNQSEVFKGLVLKGQVFHNMPRVMTEEGKKNPKLLLIKGDVSCEGAEAYTNHEKTRVAAFIEMIEACKPNVIFVEKTVSPDVQAYILDNNFTALVCNMKIKGLERIAECTGSSIFSYGDQLIEKNLGQCASFYFEEIVEEHGGVSEGGEMPKKTLIFIEDDGNFEGREKPKGRGCTILLKGSQRDELKKVKKAVKNAYSFLLRERSIKSGNIKVNDDQVSHAPEQTESRADVDINEVLESESYLILKSKKNVIKGRICKQDPLSTIKFYQQSDIPVGKLFRDEILNQTPRCTCGYRSEAHSYCYAHHNMQLTVEVRRLPKENHLDGENEGKIWMWACCGKCNGNLNFTKRVPLSKAACNLSFGKFLELGFSNQASCNMTASCGHFLYKDYIHFFGFGSMVARFGYSPESICYSVSLPNRKVNLSGSVGDEFMGKEAERVYVQGQKVFADVESCLQKMKAMYVESMLKLGGSIKKFGDIEAMLKEESDEFEAQMQPNTGYLVINHLDWIIFLESCIWDNRLHALSTYDLKVDETLPIEAPPSTEEVDSEMGLTDLKSADPTGWMWKPFQEIKKAYMKDLQRSYLPKLQPIGSDTTGSSIQTTITVQGSKLRFPMGPDDNSMVSDFKDELSSIIACALTFLNDQDLANTDLNTPPEKSNLFSFDRLDSSRFHPVASLGRLDNSIRYTVGCRFAKQFMELRSSCDLSESDFIAGLSRCKPWEAKGGKSNAFFAKTIDDRFIIKEIQQEEYDTFLKFGSKYFDHMGGCLNENGDPTCLAKIWGIYDVEIDGGKKRVLIVMENVTYGRKLIGQYDLKGALHKRLVPSFDAVPSIDPVGYVLLDQNFVRDMKVSPSYVTGEVKKNLRRAVLNDTKFLSSINVMDYSLLVGVDAEKGEILCGIIDYLRQYTWDKTLETVYKSTFVVPKKMKPTVIPPEEYKNRFLEFFDMHFQSVPGDWCSQRPSNPCTLCDVANSS